MRKAGNERFLKTYLSKVGAEYEKAKQNKKAQWALFINDPNTREIEEIMKENEDIEEAERRVL